MFRIGFEREFSSKEDIALLDYQMCVELYNITKELKDYAIRELYFDISGKVCYLNATLVYIGK